MALRVVLGGRVGVQGDGGRMAEVGPGRLAPVALAYLVCERHRPVRRDELAEVLWGDDLPSSWDQMVRGLVADLRRLLRDLGLDGNDVLATMPGCYQVRLPDGAVVDVEVAGREVVDAEVALAAGDAEAASKLAGGVTAVTSRQFLPGAGGLWVERRQADLRQIHLRALGVVAQSAIARGRFPEAVAAAEEALAMEPFRESAYVQLMVAHRGAGNRGEALRAFERCRVVLAEELGVSPSGPTESAYLTLLEDEPVAPAPALGSASPLPLPPALVAAPRSFLVGRRVELGRLDSAYERAVHEGRQAVLVGGEPGIGKSALVAAAARDAHAKGARILYGRCEEDGGLPYQPFVDAVGHYVATCPLAELAAHVAGYGGEVGRLTVELARRVPDAPAAPVTDPEADRYRLLEAVVALLSDATQVAPVVVILDDLHWAAAPTILMFRHLLRQSGPARLLVVGTYRHTELDERLPLLAALADSHREPAVDRFVLSGLDEEGVEAFVSATGDRGPGAPDRALARAIHAHTAGNPFFVGQLLRHLTESGAIYRREGAWSFYDEPGGRAVPEGVADVVARRLGRLSATANRALVLAAVVGTEFELDLLERLVDDADRDGLLDAADEAVAAHLVEELGPGRYRFAHALVRQTIYGRLTATRRVRLHRRVGEALESLPRVDASRGAELAHHFAEAAAAGCATKAADYALAAAREAYAEAAWEAAAAHLERGLDALGDPTPEVERRCDLLLLLAETWTRYVDWPRAFAVATTSVEAARACGDPERLAKAAYLFSRNAGRSRRGADRGEMAQAVSVVNEALDALGDQAPALRAKLLAVLARLPPWGRAVGEVHEATAREALTLARASGDPDALGVALQSCATMLRGSPRVQEHLALSNELVEAAPPDGWDGWREGHHSRALARLALGDRDGFEADAAACERLGLERGFWWMQWIGHLWRGTVALLDGRFADARSLVETTRELAGHRSEIVPEFCNRQLFVVACELGDWVEARKVAGDLAEGWPENPIHRGMFLLARTWNREESASGDDLERFVDEGLVPISPERVAVVLAYRVQVALRLGRTQMTGRLYESLLPWSGQIIVGGMGDGCLGAADRYLGMLAGTKGEHDRAERHYRAALASELGLQSPPLVARTRYWYGSTLLAAGGGERAHDLLHSSLQAAEELGMTGLAADARTLLR